jgi:hypothetical protein
VSNYWIEAAVRDQAGFTVENLVDVFERHLYMPNTDHVLAACGAAVANLFPGDPLWLGLVAGPSTSKTETLDALSDVPEVHHAATLTEASLLSGTSNREKAKDAKGGLLREIGDFGILVPKDFGSVLSMNQEARASALAALREIYDGAWTRHVGTDGGKTLHWAGKVGLLFGATTAIDRHHAVVSSMGERFLLYRLPEVSAEEQAMFAASRFGQESSMRHELRAAASGVVQAARETQPEPASPEETAVLVAAASFVVTARSAIHRDSYNREIEIIHTPEGPARLVKQLLALRQGLAAIGVSGEDALRITTKAAFDSMPPIRLNVVRLLAETEESMETKLIGDELGYPTGTARRACEDLAAHGLVARFGVDEKAHKWLLTERARDRFERSYPVVLSRNVGRGGESPDDLSRNVGSGGKTPETALYKPTNHPDRHFGKGRRQR